MAPFPSPTLTWHTKSYPSLSPTRPELSARGKSVVVTGAGTGIGAETARYFAQAGASRIALLGRREQPLLDTKASIEKSFPDVKVYVASTDVTKKDQVDRAVADFAGDAKIDILISNAAVTGPLEGVSAVDSEKFLDGVVQNVAGALLVAQAFLRHASPTATVVEVNSLAAYLNLVDAFASYSAAKLAVFRLWDSVAFTHPDMSIFHLQPGVVNTAMNKDAGGVDGMGFEDDVSLPASFIVWLASPEARFLKGRFLYSNWDVDELKAQAKEIEASRKFKIDLVGWPFGDTAWQPSWNAKA